MGANMDSTATNARETLRSILRPGQEVRTRVEHVSQSGMTRWISVHIAGDDGFGRDITDLVAAERGASVKYGGVKIGGAGMDMGFALVYSLSRSLWPDGFDCISDPGNARAPYDCPSNDHSNGEHNAHHGDGGYALVQRWAS